MDKKILDALGKVGESIKNMSQEEIRERLDNTSGIFTEMYEDYGMLPSYLQDWMDDVEDHLATVTAEEMERRYLAVKEQEYIEYLADRFEVPKEQMMIAIAVLEVSQDSGYWDSYYVGSESAIEDVLSKVFKD